LGELSQFYLYKIYSEGGYGVVKNDSEAKRWLQTLANNPNATMFGAVAKGLLSKQTSK
jgi:TPR repeat protein